MSAPAATAPIRAFLLRMDRSSPHVFQPGLVSAPSFAPSGSPSGFRERARLPAPQPLHELREGGGPDDGVEMTRRESVNPGRERSERRHLRHRCTPHTGVVSAGLTTFWIAASKADSSKGLGRYAATPARWTRSRVEASSCAVMKTIGMAARSAA